MSSDPPLLAVRDLCGGYPAPRGWRLRDRTALVLDRVSFDLRAGTTLGLVGESGCGKTTLSRTLLRLQPAASGTVHFRGRDVLQCSRADLKCYRRDVQVVFQDPKSSLNPRMTIHQIVAEPLVVHGLGSRRERRARVAAALEEMGLPADSGGRYPHEFSGGQRQRIAIARALILQPRLVICDEAVSALDVAIQAQILDLLGTLQRERGLSYLFISHNLAVIRRISDELAVMHAGRIVEQGTVGQVFQNPRHPYTRSLLAAQPSLRPRPKRHA